MPGGVKGCTRGVFGLSSWKTPLRRPQVWMEEEPVTSREVNVDMQNIGSPSSVLSDSSEVPTSPIPHFPPGAKLMMKYTYAANKNSPLGKEMSIKQKENVEYISLHGDALWVKIRNMQGEEGYVPSSYVMILEDKLNNLPWLQSSEPVKTVQQKAEWKPYKSAYIEGGDEENDLSKYYCSICIKQLNGPQPFAAHMISKSHKEEVAAQED